MTPNWRDISLRIGLLSTALILLGVALDIWVRGEAFRDPTSLCLSFLAFLFGIGILVLATVQKIASRATWLILIGMILAVSSSVYLTRRTYTPLTMSRTDTEMIIQYAVESLKNGDNPYAWNYADMLRVFRDQGINYTPFLDGSFESRLTYPALPILLFYVTDRIGLDFGLGTVRAVGLIAFVVLLILILKGAPEPLRPIILLPLFIFRDFLFGSLNGVQDVVWSLLLVGMLFAWKRPLWRALLYGLACSFRQQPWFVAPFLLIYLWQHEAGTPRERLRQILVFVSVSAGVFVVTNLPFFLWDPQAWGKGIFEPLYAPFSYLSYGPAILSEYGVVSFPREFHTATQVSAYAIMLIFYWFYAPVIGQGFWIFPAVFFWFYYRSLPSYWVYWIPVILPVVAGGAMRTFTFGVRWPQSGHRPRHAVPLTFATGIIIANLVWAAMLLSHERLVEVSFSPPIETFHTGLANQLTVAVHNHSDRILTPRFAVRPDYGIQTLPWHILSGPEQLGPGESGQYVIDAKTMPSREFKVARGAQLVVTDAGGDYALHASLRVPAQTNYENPDQIANPDFLYWPQDGSAPLEWALVSPPGTIASTHLGSFEGHTALTVEATTDPALPMLPVVRVQQTVTFPDRFTIWVYRTSTVMDPADNVYGIEFDDGDHRLWILFGESEQQGTLGSDNHRYIYRRALFNVWSLETIDLREIYEQMGWQQPLPSPRFARGVRYAVPQVKLSLIASAKTTDGTQWVFGTIKQEERLSNPDLVVDNALDHPDSYYVNVGDKYRSQRNYNLAEDAYLKALEYNTANSEAHFGLGESHFWLGNYAQARAEFLTALALGYPSEGNAHKGVGWSEYNLESYQVAIQRFEEAADAFLARDNPNDELSLADAYNGIGWSWLQLGDCNQAVPYFEQALDLVPTLAGAKDGLVLCTTNSS